MEDLRNSWSWLCSSGDLGKHPLAKTVLGVKVVVFRDSSGKPVALEDRCPHRNVSLSLGQVEKGQLRCAYHGWKFDGQGKLSEIPCLSSKEKLPKISGPTLYPCVEDEGSLWIWPSTSAPTEFQGWPKRPAGSSRQFEIRYVVNSPIELILDNFVDCGHTGFVHAGLFRGLPSREIESVVDELPSGLKIETLGEQDSKSILSRLLYRGDGKVEHIDELILPGTIRVNYRFGANWIQTVSTCTPISAEATQVCTKVWVHFPPFTWIVTPFVNLLTRKILRQDVRILEDQAAQLKRYGGPQFVSTNADIPTLWLSRVLKENRSGKFSRESLRKTKTNYLL